MRTRKEIQRMKKRQRNKKAITNFVTALALCGVSTSLVSAEQWVAKTPDQIVIEQGATEYVMTWGDTIWAISQKINVKTDVLLEVNELTYETARLIPVGRKIKLVQGEGNKVALEVTDKQGNVIGTRELKPEDKVDPTKDFGCDVETGEPTLKVTTDKNGNQTAVPDKNLKNPSKPTIKFQNGGNLTNDDKPSIDVNDIPEKDNGNGGIVFEPSDNGGNDNNVVTEPVTEPSDNGNNGGNTVVEPSDNGNNGGFVNEPSGKDNNDGDFINDPEHDVDGDDEGIVFEPSDNGGNDNNGGNTVTEPTEPSDNGGNTVTEPVEPSDNGGNTVTEPVDPSDNGGNTVTEPVEPSDNGGNTVTEPSDNGGNTVTEPVTEPIAPPTNNGVDIEAGNKGLWKRQMYIDAGATLGVITGDYEVDGDLGRYSSREEARNNAEIVLNSDMNFNMAWDYEDGKTDTPPVNGWYSEQGFGENTWKVLFR